MSNNKNYSFHTRTSTKKITTYYVQLRLLDDTWSSAKNTNIEPTTEKQKDFIFIEQWVNQNEASIIRAAEKKKFEKKPPKIK